jgi:RND family efflux transporter MFP subunit
MTLCIKLCSTLILVFGLSGCGKKKDAIRLPEPAKSVASSSVKGPTAKPAVASTAKSASKGEPDGTPTMAVRKSQRIASLGTLIGTTKARRSSTLGPKVSGGVDAVLVKAGQMVKKGTPLVRLDGSDFRLHLRAALAARKTAEARLRAVEVEYKRLRPLVKAKAVPQSKFDAVDSQFKIAQAAMGEVAAGIARARSALAKVVIKAPFSGLVTAVLTSEGEYATVMPATPLVVIQEVEHLELIIEVPENRMGQVHVGTPIKTHFRAINKTIDQKVTRIVPSLDPRTRSFKAIVDFANPQFEYRPGMFAAVSVIEAAK